MLIESHGPQFTLGHPPILELSQVEQDINELIPILAHVIVRRFEQKGFSGKVRVQAMAGDSWGVAKSPENLTDIPNVIIYPRKILFDDRRVVNALLRHEIGNLNYPIDSVLNTLRGWCYENKVAPELLTSLVEVIHEASVNYLEIQNSHSNKPEENFRALYEQEINTQEIVNCIPQSAPYKQAVDLTLLYSLSQARLVKPKQFEQALESAHSTVQEIFDKQTRSILDQSIKMASPKKQVQLVRDFIWPKFSKLVALSDLAKTESESGKANDIKKTEISPEASVRVQLAKEIQERMQKLIEKMKQKPPSKADKKPSQESQNKQKKESKQPRQEELSPAEKQERKNEESLLVENLQEQLKQAKEQLEKLQKPSQQPEALKLQEKSSMQEIGKQAEQIKDEAEKAMQEAKEAGADKIIEEQLQKLKEQLEQLEEVAKQIAESGALEEELVKPEEEPITYNINEYGINEAELTPEQLETLQKIRTFAQSTSKAYRTVMRLLMTGYQQKNPNFTDKMIQKMMDHGYDVPDFSIYGSQSAQEFLSQREELGVNIFSDNFLVNFQLPKPLAKFWYKGGNGSKSVPVKDGEIEWGHFYRMCMPIIYNGVDRSKMSGLYLNRLNSFGQHDPKKYYYLWEATNSALENQANESNESNESEDSEKDKGDYQDSENGEFDEDQEQGSESNELGSESEQEEGQSEGAGNDEQVGWQDGELGEKGSGEYGGSESGGGITSAQDAQEMQEMLSQMQDMLNHAKEQGSQGGMLGSDQEAIDQLLEKIDQIQQSLESGGNPEEMVVQMQDAMQQLSEMIGGEHDQGEIHDEGSGDSPIESSEQSHDQFQKGGQTNEKAVEDLFSKPNEELLKQLRKAEEMVGSKFTTKDKNGNLVTRDVSQSISENLKAKASQAQAKAQAKQIEILENIKREQQSKMEAIYQEMSELDGEALRLYIDYMESNKGFINDLKKFFIEKFRLDKEFLRERNLHRGARLQRGFTQNILGEKGGRIVISPRSFERKRLPEKPQLAWTLVIDNSGSCDGEIIEQEKKLAVALIEVAKEIDIPLEIITFGGPNKFIFLKHFEQEDISDYNLQKIVLLNATVRGTPDVITLEAACTSISKFTDKYNRSYNFVYFMTDGQSSEGSIKEVIERYKKDMVITGIGIAEAAKTITPTWGKNAVEVPNPEGLSAAFIRKIEDQIDLTFS